MSFFGDLWEGVTDIAEDFARELPGAAVDIFEDFVRGEIGGGGGGGQNRRIPTPGFGGGPIFAPGTVPVGGEGLGPLLPPPTQQDNVEISEAGFGIPGFDVTPGQLADIAIGAGRTALEIGGFSAVSEFLGMGDDDVATLTSVRGRGTIQTRAATGMRLPREVVFVAPTPSGGQRIVAYRNMGRPILYSGDLAAVKRVNRVARRAKKRAGGR